MACSTTQDPFNYGNRSRELAIERAAQCCRDARSVLLRSQLILCNGANVLARPEGIDFGNRSSRTLVKMAAVSDCCAAAQRVDD